MAALLRLIFLVPLGYLLAAVAAGFVLTYGYFQWPVYWDEKLYTFGFMLARIVQAAAIGFFPAIVAIAIGEAFALRSVIYWLIAGGAIGMLPYLAPGPWRWSNPPDEFMLLYAAAGFAGALVYWLVAGRLAGAGLRSGPRPGSA